MKENGEKLKERTDVIDVTGKKGFKINWRRSL